MSTPMTDQDIAPMSARSGLLQRAMRKAVLAKFSQIEHGQLTVTDGDMTVSFGRRDHICQSEVMLHVRHPDFFVEVALGGTIGGAEAYMQNFWTCDDLTELIRLLIRNRHVLDSMESGFARLKAPLRRYSHWRRRNHPQNSHKNIEAHYDLGNEFFRLFLDSTMMYSSGIFPATDAPLKVAQETKLDRICRRLQLKPGDEVVEIGTGWGGFALHAARNYGCHVTTTTISEEQFRLARDRVAEAGLSERVTVVKKDYRAMTGRFDKLVSIEMIEAVGHRFFDAYFAKCSELLKPDGQMMLQAITIGDQQYQNSKRSVDFIQKYIFPGGALPSMGAITDSVARVTDLRIVDVLDIGPHYAETLRHWHRRFFDHLSEVRALGFPDEFIRMWKYYFCYCEAGFEERVIGDLQVLMNKPLCKAGSLA